MTTETSNARGEWVLVPHTPTPEMIEAGILFGTSPNKATIIYQSMVNAAPPPAAARGDVRGLPAGWTVEVDGEHVKVKKPDGAVSEWHKRPATNGSGMYDLCQALAAEGVQAGEVEQRGVPEYTSAPTYGPKDMQAAWRSGYNTHAMGGRVGGIDAPEAYSFDAELVADMLSNYQRRVAAESGESARTRVIQQQVDALRAIVAALSQQPEARGVVDGLSPQEIERGWEATFSTTNPFCPCDLKSFTKAVRWAERALTGERNG